MDPGPCCSHSVPQNNPFKRFKIGHIPQQILDNETRKRFHTRIVSDQSIHTDTYFGDTGKSAFYDSFATQAIEVHPGVTISRECFSSAFMVKDFGDFVHIIVPQLLGSDTLSKHSEPKKLVQMIALQLFQWMENKEQNPHTFSYENYFYKKPEYVGILQQFCPIEELTFSTTPTNDLQSPINEEFEQLLENVGIMFPDPPIADSDSELEEDFQAILEILKKDESVYAMQYFNAIGQGVPSARAVENLCHQFEDVCYKLVFFDGIQFPKDCWIAAYERIEEYGGKGELDLGICKAAYVLFRQQFKEEERLQGLQGTIASSHIKILAIKRATACLLNIYKNCLQGKADKDYICKEEHRYECNAWLSDYHLGLIDHLVIKGTFEFKADADKATKRQQMKEQTQKWKKYIAEQLSLQQNATSTEIANSGIPNAEVKTLQEGTAVVEIAIKELKQIGKDFGIMEGTKKIFDLIFSEREIVFNSVSGKKGGKASWVTGQLNSDKINILKKLAYFLSTKPSDKGIASFDIKSLNDEEVEKFWSKHDGHDLTKQILTDYRNYRSQNLKKNMTQDADVTI